MRLWFFGIGALIIYSFVLFLVLRKYYRDLTRKYRILFACHQSDCRG